MSNSHDRNSVLHCRLASELYRSLVTTQVCFHPPCPPPPKVTHPISFPFLREWNCQTNPVLPRITHWLQPQPHQQSVVQPLWVGGRLLYLEGQGPAAGGELPSGSQQGSHHGSSVSSSLDYTLQDGQNLTGQVSWACVSKEMCYLLMKSQPRSWLSWINNSSPFTVLKLTNLGPNSAFGFLQYSNSQLPTVIFTKTKMGRKSLPPFPFFCVRELRQVCAL